MTKRHVVLRTLKPKPRRPEHKLFQKKKEQQAGPPKAPKQSHLYTKVLRLGPDHTIQPRKPRTGHFYSLLNMKNHSMQKKL